MPRPNFVARIHVGDHRFLALLHVFVDGKAMALLTFLFGLGFALQLQRADRDGRTGVPEYLRRLTALAAIGVGHVLLLWWGDILWGYAVAGVGLLLFRRCRGWKLLAWAFGLSLLPQLVATLPAVSKALSSVLPRPTDPQAFRAQVLAAISGHDRLVLTQMQIKQAYYHVHDRGDEVSSPRGPREGVSIERAPMLDGPGERGVGGLGTDKQGLGHRARIEALARELCLVELERADSRQRFEDADKARLRVAWQQQRSPRGPREGVSVEGAPSLSGRGKRCPN